MDVEKWTIVADQSTPAFEAAIQAAMEQGYSVSQSNGSNLARLEVGSKVARALLGGWIRRHQIDVMVQQGPDGSTEVWMLPAMSGWGGGAIGKSKASSEHKRLTVGISNNLLPTGLASGHRTEKR